MTIEESYLNLNQNRWNKEKVINFLNLHKIDTSSAVTPYPEPILEFGEDGDSWYKVILPIWRFNKYVVKSILNLGLLLLNTADCDIYFSNSNELTIYFYISICDPD